MNPPRILLRTLGAFELCSLHDDGRPGDRILGPGKPLALLAFCSSAREREQSRESLATLLWSDADPARARQSLRQALWRVQRATGDLVHVRDDAVAGVDASIVTDRERFLDALHRGDMRAALDAYCGPFLSGASFPGGDEFDEWASLERRHLEDGLVRGAESFLQATLRAGKPALARSLAEQLLRVAPDSIEAHRVATDCLVGAGDAAGARRTADQLEAMLHADGSRVSPAVAALLARARDDETLRDAGRPQPVSLDLVGREAAFATALAAWRSSRRGETHIVVIGGVAGIGKSRLLAAIAERCSTRQALAVSVRANAGERGLPFGFAATLARALSSLPGAAGIGAESARELVALDPGLGSVFHAVPSQLDGGEAVRRRALAVLDLITAITEQESLALFMDDMHWADPASRQLLAIVLGRAVGLPLLIVATTRGGLAGLFDDRTTTAIALEPLTRGDVVDAIRSTGVWPDVPEASEFISVVADSCDGIPLQVVERLALMEERALIGRVDGAWSSPAWADAIAAASVGSPVGHRVRECSRDERAVLLTLSIAGAPADEAVIKRAFGDARERAGFDVHELLAALETKGLATRTGQRWQPVHDVVAEHAITMAPPEERSAAHLAVGRALFLHGDVDDAAAAVRHLVTAEDDTRAGEAFARLLARARASGDRRNAPDLLATITGDALPLSRRRQLLRAVPLWNRVRWPHAGVTVVCALLLIVVSTSLAISATQKPGLTFAQAPMMMVPAPLLGPNTFQLVPAAIVTTAEAQHQNSVSAQVVRVTSLSPDVEFISIDSAAMTGGRAAFGALRLRTSQKRVSLQFHAEGLSPLDLEVGSTDHDLGLKADMRASARIVSGRVNGVPLRGDKPMVRVSPGATLTGVIQLEYDAPWRSASVWLSTTPTWGDAAESARELFPVTTPVRQEVIDVPVDAKVPDTPGRWWLLYVIDAEPSGGFALSGTNWTAGKALWGDGNDIATLGDSVLRSAITAGQLFNWRAFASSHTTDPCKPRDERVRGVLVHYCSRDAGIAGIEVIVE